MSRLFRTAIAVSLLVFVWLVSSGICHKTFAAAVPNIPASRMGNCGGGRNLEQGPDMPVASMTSCCVGTREATRGVVLPVKAGSGVFFTPVRTSFFTVLPRHRRMAYQRPLVMTPGIRDIGTVLKKE